MDSKFIEHQVKKILVHNKIHYLLQKIRRDEQESQAREIIQMKTKMEEAPLFGVASQIKIAHESHEEEPPASANREEFVA
jgi:hypothetical protein